MKKTEIRTEIRTRYKFLKNTEVVFQVVSDFLKSFEAKDFLGRRKSRENPRDFHLLTNLGTDGRRKTAAL